MTQTAKQKSDRELISEVKTILDDINKRVNIAQINYDVLKRLTKDAKEKLKVELEEYRNASAVRKIIFKRPSWYKFVKKEKV